VINRCKNGDHYWVYANVTASRDHDGSIISYHSNRTVPDCKIVQQFIAPLYQALLFEENRHNNAKTGMNASFQMLVDVLKEKTWTMTNFYFLWQVRIADIPCSRHSLFSVVVPDQANGVKLQLPPSKCMQLTTILSFGVKTTPNWIVSCICCWSMDRHLFFVLIMPCRR